MNATPRTDLAVTKFTLIGGVANELHGGFADFARELERELAAEQEKCDKLLSVLVYADQILDDIDTCSDAHKPMYSTYSQNVFKLCIKGRDARRAAIDAAMKEGAK